MLNGNWDKLMHQAMALELDRLRRKKAEPWPLLQVAAVGGKNRLLAGTSAHLCMAARTFEGITKPISRISLFTTADGRLAAITRDAIDKGLPQAAGIPIIDGDKVEEPVEPAAP